MSARPVFRTLMATLTLLAVGALPAEGQDWWPGSSGSPDTQYVMDENGNYTGQKNTILGDHTGGNRYACRPGSGGYSCNPCGNCHTSTQVADRSYVLQFDSRKHAGVHFPKLEAKLQPTQKVLWGGKATLTMRNTEVVAQSRTTPPKDLVIFPSGSKIFLNQKGEAVFVRLPSTGEPRAVTTR